MRPAFTDGMNTSTGIRGIDSTLQKTQLWLGELCAELGWKDKHMAYSALRAVLHALRDRLPVNQAASLGAQLPLLIRGLFYDGWRPSDVPLRVRHREDFLDLVREELDRNHAITEEPDRIVEAVLALLGRHCGSELRKLELSLPRELQQLFPHPPAQPPTAHP